MVLVAKYYLVHLILYLRMYTCIAYSLLTIGKPWWKATVQKKNCHEHTLSIAENKRNNCQKKNENIKIKIKSSFFVKTNEYLSILNIVTLTYYLYDNVYTFLAHFAVKHKNICLSFKRHFRTLDTRTLINCT